MPLTSQPVKTGGSIGTVKVDTATPPNTTNYVPAAEFEKIKDFLIDVCDEVGNTTDADNPLNDRVDTLETNTTGTVAPEAVGRANAAGSDADLARADHVHDGGPVAVSAIDDTDSPWDMETTHQVVLVDSSAGAVDINLPDPTVDARTWTVIQTAGTNAISLVRAASEDINGVAATFQLPGSTSGVVTAWLVVSDGTDWWVV